MSATKAHLPESANPAKRPKRRKAGRFIRGYFMLVGAAATAAALVLLIVRLFVQIEKWVR